MLRFKSTEISNFVFRIIRLLELKNILLLTGGGAIAQLITVLSQPISTRLYSPSDFGVVALFISLVSMFIPSLNLQLHLNIVSAENEREADVLTTLSLIAGLFSSSLIFILIVLYDLYFPWTFKGLGNYIFLVFPVLLLSSVTNVITSRNNRFREYKLLSKIALYKASVSNLLKITFGLLNYGSNGLIISTVVSFIIGIKKQSREFLENYKRILITDKQELHAILVKYKNQPIFSTPGIFVVSFSYSIIPLYINELYDSTEVGFYTLAMSVLGIPITMLSANVGTIFFRKASEEIISTGNYFKTFISSLSLLFALSLIPFTLLLFYSEALFISVFGILWQRSGYFVLYVLPWVWMNFIVGALIGGLIISKKQFLKLLLQMLFVVESFCIFKIAEIYKLSIEDFLLLISCFYAASYFIILIVIYQESKKDISSKIVKITS